MNIFSNAPTRAVGQASLIAAMGIPGCGKSSVMSALGQRHGIPVFNEPEEAEWPEAVHNRVEVGSFTAITWFRSFRVPQLYKASHLRALGQTAIVDSYFDKLLSRYILAPEMKWLMARADPYFGTIEQMSQLDYDLLPDADILVFFRITEALWRQLLLNRDRRLDTDSLFLLSFGSQERMEAAAAEYCDLKGCRLVVFEQSLSTPEIAADRLSHLLWGY